MPSQNSPNQPGSGQGSNQNQQPAQQPAQQTVNTQPIATDVSNDFEVRSVNPPLTPDQIVGIQEAPLSQQMLPTLKLQKIEPTNVKSKTLVGHLKAIEAKMIATEKLLDEVVKLQNLQIVTQKELHLRKKELYQNTFEEYLLDKSIDFGQKKKKGCTCISLPDNTTPGAVPVPLPGGAPATAPSTAPATAPSTAPVTTPNTSPANQPNPLPPIFQPGPNQPIPFPAPTPVPPTRTPPVGIPGLSFPPILPPFPMPEDLLPQTLGVTPLSTPITPITPENPLTLPSATNPFDLELGGTSYGGTFTESTATDKPKTPNYQPLAYKPFQSVIDSLKQATTEQEKAELLEQAVKIGAGLQMGVTVVMNILRTAGAIGAAVGTSLLPQGAYAKGGIPGGDLELYNSQSQQYFRKLSNEIGQIASDVPVGPHTPLPFSGYVRPQGSHIPRPNLRGMPGPLGNPMPWGYDPTRMLAKGGIVKKYDGGGWLQQLGKFLPGTGTVMAPKTMGNATVAGYQDKLLGIPLGNTRYVRDSAGYGTGYSQPQMTRYEQQNPDKHFINAGGQIPKLVKKQNFVADAFANFGNNVNTIQNYAKRQEEMMRQMGHEPDGYVNLLGQPIKKNATGRILNFADGGITGVRGGFTTRFGGQVGQMLGLTGGVDFKSGKTTGSANAMLGYGNTMERTSAQQAVTEGLTSTQFGGNWDGIPYALPTSGTDTKSGIVGSFDAKISGSLNPLPQKSLPDDIPDKPEKTKRTKPRTPESFILRKGQVKPKGRTTSVSENLEGRQNSIRNPNPNSSPPVIPLPPNTVPIRKSKSPSRDVGTFDGPDGFEDVPNMFVRQNSMLQ